MRSQRAFLRVAIQSPADAVSPSARMTVAGEAGVGGAGEPVEAGAFVELGDQGVGGG